MNLPSSQTTPDGFDTLPARQKQHTRLAIRNANEAELSSYLRRLQSSTAFNLDAFLLLLVSALLLTAALVWDLWLLLMAACLLAPLYRPLLGTALGAASASFEEFLRSILALLPSLLTYFFAGWLARRLGGAGLPLNIFQQFLIRSNWLEWLLLALSAALLALMFLRQREGFRLPGVLLNALLILPVALSGWLLKAGYDLYWLPVSYLSLARAGLALVTVLVVHFLIGLAPRKAAGWIIFGICVLAAGAAFFGHFSTIAQIPSFKGLMMEAPISEALAPATEVTVTEAAPAPTATPSNTVTPTPTKTLTPTQTPSPTPAFATISSESGVIVRAQPNYDAERVTYVNFGVEIELLGEDSLADTTLWVKIRAPNGEIGWIVGRFMRTATPAN